MGYRTVYITERCRCSYQNGYLVVRAEEQTMVHLSEISVVVLESTASFVSSYLLSELAKAKIPVVACDSTHNPIGLYLPLHGSHDSSRRMHEQAEWDHATAERLWRRIVMSKIGNQSAVLRSAGLAQAELLDEYISQVEPGDETNREGHAAKVYFNALFGGGFSRHDDCAINAQLNYGYAILLAWVNREICSRGYATELGIKHRGGQNCFNLGCDLMEPFRPVIDWYVAANWENGMDKQVKAELLALFSSHHQTIDGVYRLSSILSLCVKNCLAIMGGRLDVGDYWAFDFHAE